MGDKEGSWNRNQELTGSKKQVEWMLIHESKQSSPQLVGRLPKFGDSS